MGEKIRKVTRTTNELAAELEREPTEEEIAQTLGWTVEEVRDAKEAIPDATSLNRSLGSNLDSKEDAAAKLGEFVEDEREPQPDGEVIGEMESAFLREAIGRLPERHRYVLGRRYGLDGREPTSLADLGRELDVSRERVRQLQGRAEHVLKRAQS